MKEDQSEGKAGAEALTWEHGVFEGQQGDKCSYRTE